MASSRPPSTLSRSGDDSDTEHERECADPDADCGDLDAASASDDHADLDADDDDDDAADALGAMDPDVAAALALAQDTAVVLTQGDQSDHDLAKVSEDDDDDDEDDALGSWQQLVFQRPSESLAHVEIFASGSGFEHLLVLNLQQNAIQDLSPIVSTARTLRVLNVAHNELAQLPGAEFWSRFVHLRLCFLAHNKLQHWRDMDGLEACGTALRWLTLHGNPIMALTNARAFVVNKLPLLRALDDFVVTDQEYIRAPGTSTRFAPMSPLMDVSSLHMPLEFADDNFALAYASDTEARIQSLHAKNSPSIVLQRVARGFLSRCSRLPRLAHICALVTRVQSCARGFLFRRMIARSFTDVVARAGQTHLLMLSSTDSPLLPTTARRGLKKLVVYIQEWQRKFHLKKQAIAIKKIRFWCQMAYQRYVYKSKRLLQEEHEVCVYYTPAFESELLAIAEKAAHRDPFLMAMTLDDRTQFIHERCTHSGVSVLRLPHQSTCSLQVESPMMRPRHSHGPHKALERNARASGDAVASMTAIVRVFPKDESLENRLLITEKAFLQRDLERIAALQREHQQALQRSDQSSSRSNRSLDASDVSRRQPRAVLLHLAQLATELSKRLVICNKKILAACIKQQQWEARAASMRFSLARVAIRPRGHTPARWERKKIKALQRSQTEARRTGAVSLLQPTPPESAASSPYAKMRVLIPWSIDMYLQIMSALDRTLAASCGPAFALSYEQTRRVHAAVSIQSAWRAFVRQSKRNALEVAIARALLCIQRWWRFRLGLRRRMDFVRACVLLGASITSRTLFMEESVYCALSSAASWTAVRSVLRPCKEQGLHCCMVDSKVSIVLSPSALLLRSHSQRQHGWTLASASSSASSFRAASAQRCSAYLPVWLPGTPEHNEVSMTARDEDATPLLLVERVVVEPTLLERELLLRFGSRQSRSSASTVLDAGAQLDGDPTGHYQRFAMGRSVAETSAHVVELAQRLARKNKHLAPTVFALESTSLVRLTFESVDEARRRALVLLSKTFDPVTRSYAQLHSIEALVGSALRHHQWALGQVATPDESAHVLAGCAMWLRADFPSPWWTFVERRLSSAALAAMMAARVPLLSLSEPSAPTRPDSAPLLKPPGSSKGQPHRSGAAVPALETRAVSSPSSTLIPRPPRSPTNTKAPSPLRVTVPSIVTRDCDQQHQHHTPRPPSATPDTPTSGGSSRHQLLANRVGKAAYASLEEMHDAELEAREYAVRDLREERERAMEALIVDRRMIQREHAAEVAGIKLAIDVELQKLRYAREIEKLHVRELIEHEKLTSARRKLTRHFETRFAAQTGAMMRLAAREALGRTRGERDALRTERAETIAQQSHDARERRQDAKSYWFVRNQQAKAEMSREHIRGAEVTDERAHVRRMDIRKRIREDKEIKAMLRLV